MHGQRKLIRGEKNFFLQPGETLKTKAEVNVLTSKQALKVTATEQFVDVRIVITIIFLP